MEETIPCPFIYANGKRCTGQITRVEAYKADLEWHRKENGTWKLHTGFPRSHYHLFCSEKDNHAGYGRRDSDQLKFYLGDMPDGLWKAMNAAEG